MFAPEVRPISVLIMIILMMHDTVAGLGDIPVISVELNFLSSYFNQFVIEDQL